MRVSRLSIYKDDVKVKLEDMDVIGNIGVDAGMAGFFNNKKNFTDEEWDDLCNRVEKGDAWAMFDGIFSSSGYGDGSYDVYANEDRTAFTIVFID